LENGTLGWAIVSELITRSRSVPGRLKRVSIYYFVIPYSLDFELDLYFENDRLVEQPTSFTKGSSQPPRGVFWRPGAIAPHFEFREVLPNLKNKAISVIRKGGRTPG
jgi:hypothetical protein